MRYLEDKEVKQNRHKSTIRSYCNLVRQETRRRREEWMLQMQNAMLHFLCILTRPRISIQGVPLVPTTQSGHKNDKGGRFARRPQTEWSPFSFASLRLVQPLAIAFRDSVTNLINVSRLCSGNFAQLSAKRLLGLSVTACLHHLRGNRTTSSISSPPE